MKNRTWRGGFRECAEIFGGSKALPAGSNGVDGPCWMNDCRLEAAITPAGLRAWRRSLQNAPLVAFCRTVVRPRRTRPINEKCHPKGGIFRLNGGPCWMNDCRLEAAITPAGLRAWRRSLQNAPLVAFCRTVVRPRRTRPINEKCHPKGGIFRLNGGPCWIRTSDQLVKSRIANFHVIDFI